jgi:ppGpp synthetase/RelA/SpoT-type nucleotidyltranferase
MGLSKAQIDKLGERLREGEPSADDLRLLDEYRLSFGEPFAIVIKTISEQLQLEPTGRPAKTTRSITEKLQRESIRLTQVQDIAGCRLVVGRALDQDRAVASLCEIFPSARVADRRASPSHGYRAVHVIVQISGKTIEIQVRTDLQHLWAEFSEKLSDVLDPTIKYGGGDEDIRRTLNTVSKAVEENERIQQRIDVLEERIEALAPEGVAFLAQEKVQLEEMRETMIGRQQQLSERLRDLLVRLSGLRKRP